VVTIIMVTKQGICW